MLQKRLSVVVSCCFHTTFINGNLDFLGGIWIGKFRDLRRTFSGPSSQVKRIEFGIFQGKCSWTWRICGMSIDSTDVFIKSVDFTTEIGGNMTDNEDGMTKV